MAKKKAAKKKDDFIILPELELLIEAHSEDSLLGLEELILKDGVVNYPLSIWVCPRTKRRILVDGHNRHKIATKHNIPYKTIEVWPVCKTLEDVKARMKKEAAEQRSLPRNIRDRYRSEYIIHESDVNGSPISDLVSKMSEETGMTERQIYRGLEKARKINTLIDSCRNSLAVSELSCNMIDKLSALDKASQHALIERAGYEKKNIIEEIRRITKKPGTPLNKQTKEKADSREAERAAREKKKKMWKSSSDSLADTFKLLSKTRRELKVTDKKWGQVRIIVERLNDILEGWKEDIK